MRRLRTVFKVRLMTLAVVAMVAAMTVVPVAIINADVPSLKAETPAFSVRTVGVTGVSSDINNVAFAFDGKYSVVAPFETSDPDRQAPFEGDNHYLIVTELANPSHSVKLDLAIEGGSPATCYYPTHLIVSSNNIALVRATSADAVTHQPIAEVIAYGSLVLDKESGEPSFNGAIVPVKIPKFLAAADPGSMPIGFGVSSAGGFLVFTNGAQVFSVDFPTGSLYQMQPVPGDQYAPVPDPEDIAAASSDYQTITSLDVDSNNVVKVLVNGRSRGNDFSRLFFYKLREGVKHAGTMDLLAPPVDSASLRGAQIAPGSMVAVSENGSVGYFATTDGTLWSVELKNSASLNVMRLKDYASISGESGYQASPRNVLSDPAGRTLSITKQGATVNIRRPSYGRHGGGIRRPSYVKYTGNPGFVLVNLSPNGSIASDLEAHDQGFGMNASPYAISNPVFTDAGAYLTVSYGDSQGALKLLEKSTGFFRDFGALPSNIGHVASPDGSNIVGIEDFQVSFQGSGPGISKGGSLVFMSLRQSTDSLVRSSGYRAAIRRPCNVGR